MRPLLGVLGAASGSVHAQDGPDWRRLLAADSVEAAASVCGTRTSAPEATVRADAHMCLANVEVRDAEEVLFLGNGPDGGSLGPRLVGDAIDRALAHLDTARAATPADASIYQGQLYLITQSGRFERAPAIVRAAVAHTDAPLDTWHAYLGEFYARGAIEEGIEVLRALHEAAPDDPSLLADLGGFLVLAERDAEAEPLLVRAVEMAPNDPANLWNLGRFRYYAGDHAEAEALYRQAIGADPEWADTSGAYCLLADLGEGPSGVAEADTLRAAHGCTE